MFNLQGSELIIILLLALVVLGPEKLPEAMRKAGNLYAELKKMSSGFQQEFRAAMDEPVKEMRDTAAMLRDSADFTKLQSGERPEKPHSADMVAASDAEAKPATAVPFGGRRGPGATPGDADRADAPSHETDSGEPAADPAAGPASGAAGDPGDEPAGEVPPERPAQRWSFDLPARDETATQAAADTADVAEGADPGEDRPG